MTTRKRLVPVLYLDLDGTVRHGHDELGRFVNGPDDVVVFPEATAMMRRWNDDVRTAIEWWRSEPRPIVDLVCGGFPCQPVSVTGLGLAQDDERWLWPEMADVIDAFRPEWVVWENVPGLRTRGLDIVHTDLVRLGYHHRVGRIRACEVGAPHPRPRLLGVAHAPRHRRGTRRPRGSAGSTPLRTDLAPQGVDRRAGTGSGSGHWACEPGVARLADGLPRRVVERAGRAFGNAVVPAIGEYIGRLLLSTEGRQ